MTLGRMWYKPSVDVEFTREEVFRMIHLSETHYDGLCRSLSVPGRDAILNGIRNRFEVTKGDTVVERLDATQADLLSKVCERDPILLYKMQQVFRVLNDKWNEMNPQPW